MLKTLIHRIFALVAVAAIVVPALPAAGQFTAPGSGQPQQPQRVTAELILYEGRIVPGQAATIGVLLDIQDTWKIQAGRGSGDEMRDSIPTEVRLSVPDGWSAGDPLWPAAKPFTIRIGDVALDANVYEDRTLIIVPVIVPETAALGEHEIRATVKYQACDPTRCDLPTDASARMTVKVVAADDAGSAPQLDEEIAGLFKEVLARHEGASPTTTASPPAAAAPGAGGSSFARPRFFGITIPHAGGWLGLLLLAFFAAIGGFILNLTPCVLPVIPIKIMTIIQHANHPGKNLVLGLWMFLGVVCFWVALGLPVAFVAGVTDPSRIFGIWWLTLGIGVVIALMALGIMGLFAIQLPGAVYAINPKADSPWGSFVFGVMTGVLGLPCFGFVAGALLAGAATMPVTHVMTIFGSLGIGMALPYMVLSLKPSWVERIPRTGPASELVKQVMGLLLLAAAAYFVGSGLIALVNEVPYLGRQLHWWAIAVFAAVAGLWLVVRTFQITRHVVPRAAFLLIGVLLGGAAVIYAADSTMKARSDWQARADVGDTGGYVHGAWNRWTPAAFERAKNDGHILVLDFTAEWCLNCKALKAAVLDREPVRSLLNKNDVVKFTVDLTSTRDPGWDFLRDLGQTGIPLLVIYTPGVEEPWQANAYTSQQVVAALEEARAQLVAQR